MPRALHSYYNFNYILFLNVYVNTITYNNYVLTYISFYQSLVPTKKFRPGIDSDSRTGIYIIILNLDTHINKSLDSKKDFDNGFDFDLTFYNKF